MIKFKCKCGKQITVDSKYAGKKGKCPQCKDIVIVPSKGQAKTEKAVQGKLVSVEGEKIHLTCPNCDESIVAVNSKSGKPILCGICGKNVIIPSIKPETKEVPKLKSEHSAQDQIQLSLKKETKDCPYCGEEILEKAMKCKHCGEFLEDESEEAYQIGFGSGKRNVTSSESLKSKFLVFRVLMIILGITVGFGLIIFAKSQISNKPREIEIPEKSTKADDAIKNDCKLKFGGLVTAFKDIKSAYEIGMNYADFKQLLFNLNREWNSLGILSEAVKKTGNYRSAEKAVDCYKKAFDAWGNYINDIFKQKHKDSRDEYLKEANSEASYFISNYEFL